MRRRSNCYIPDMDDCANCPDIWTGCCTRRCRPFLPIRFMKSYGEGFLTTEDKKKIFEKKRSKEDSIKRNHL